MKKPNVCDWDRCESPPEGRRFCKAHAYIESTPRNSALFKQKDVGLKTWTYFVWAENGLIKIGRADGLSQRFSCLQGSSPLPLKLIAAVYAWPGLETELHALFKAERVRGEWFTNTPRLRMIIEAAGLGMNAIAQALDIQPR